LVALLADDAPIRRNIRDGVLRWNLLRSRGWQSSHAQWAQPAPGETATIALASMSSRAAPALAESLDHGDPVVRRNAAWGLGELRHPRDIPEPGLDALTATLDDPDPSVRAAAAWALGDIRVRRAIPRLIEILAQDPEERVRALAAEALGEIRAAAAEETLAEAARDDANPSVRRAARYGLKEVIEHGH
ncbi:MAG: HEAT repeat domain-containing protein, partial [Acidobacteriota bacterium]